MFKLLSILLFSSLLITTNSSPAVIGNFTISPTELSSPNDVVLPPGFSNCGDSTDSLILQSVQVTPYPPFRGQEVKINATGVIQGQAIAKGASFKVFGKWSFFTVV